MDGNKITFMELLAEESVASTAFHGVDIPRIQRDYAQGRKSAKSIRDNFLQNLHDALSDPTGEITLDFVYGNIENGKLVPLDGQQRLTTLFLLHWYAAKKDSVNDEYYMRLKNFSYETRFSARAFCEGLITKCEPDLSQKLSAQIFNQSWFPLEWGNDPTIESMLTMIDSISSVFGDVNGLWKRLVDDKSVTFYFIPIEDMGITDDIYIKMNSRGKPLTMFEHFKAEFDKAINNPSISLKIDTTWTDMLWKYRSSDKLNPASKDNEVIDDEFMRYFQLITFLICTQRGIPVPENEFKMATDVYSDPNNVGTFEACMDCWCDMDIDDFFNQYLTSDNYVEGKVSVFGWDTNIFLDCISAYEIPRGQRNVPFGLNKTLMLYAFLLFRIHHAEIADIDFRRRIRIVRNLIWNAEDNLRNEKLPELLKEVDSIILHGIVDTEIKGFTKIQKEEEIEKLKIENSEILEEVFKTEDSPFLYGNISVIGQNNIEAMDTFRKTFGNIPLSLIGTALLAEGDCSRFFRWRYQIGSSDGRVGQRIWQEILHPSNMRGLFAATQQTLLKLLNDVKDNVSPESFQAIVSNYLESEKTRKDWRYYAIKYPVIQSTAKFGMVYFYQHGGAASKSVQYDFIVMHTEKSLGGRNQGAILLAVYDSFKHYKNVSFGDYSFNNDNPIVVEINDEQYQLFMDNNAYRLVSTSTGQAIVHDIPQDKVGIDLADRVAMGRRIIRELLPKDTQSIVDTTFDFTTDVPNYWDSFWENKGGRGGGNADSDPDAVSPMLQKYHQLLWSKELPCGEKMELQPYTLKFNDGHTSLALQWKDFIFTSDSISVGHRYQRMERILEEFKQSVPDYKAYVEDFIHKSYTIGGMMIWPCRGNSINQTKGCNWAISDRMDRTLECIRRFYIGEESPMAECLEKDRNFFELFVDFKGFVDYFFFQDLVSEDYKSVKMLMGTNDLSAPALAQTVEEYRLWLERQLDFVAKRNERIHQYCLSH